MIILISSQHPLHEVVLTLYSRYSTWQCYCTSPTLFLQLPQQVETCQVSVSTASAVVNNSLTRVIASGQALDTKNKVASADSKSVDQATVEPSKGDGDANTEIKNICKSPDKDRDKLTPVMYSLPLQSTHRSFISREKFTVGRGSGTSGFNAKRPFNVPKFPLKDPTAFDPNSTDHSLEDSPIRPRKRRVVESEAEADNLDDLIASLKRVAERDMKPSVFDKIKKKASNRNIPVESLLVEKLSLLNLPKRSDFDDDDLESLESVDTDMAPASETSRDLECTYSDIESINESISSRGDILANTRVHTPIPDVDAPKSSKITIDHEQELFRSEANLKLSSGYSSASKNRKWSSNVDRSSQKIWVADPFYQFEILPVEKLEAMIAELDQVISDTDSDDEDSSDTVNKFSVIDVSKKESTSAESVAKETSSGHFTIEEIHVADGVNFSTASTSFQKSHQQELENASSVSVSTVTANECSSAQVVGTSGNFFSSIDQSVASAVSFIPASDKSFPVSENATLVTLISRPTSEESLTPKKTAVKNSNEHKNIEVVNAKIVCEVSGALVSFLYYTNSLLTVSRA